MENEGGFGLGEERENRVVKGVSCDGRRVDVMAGFFVELLVCFFCYYFVLVRGKTGIIINELTIMALRSYDD